MKDVWAWVAGVLIAIAILSLMAYGRAERRAYRAARGVVVVIAAQEAPVELRAVQPEERPWRSR